LSEGQITSGVALAYSMPRVGFAGLGGSMSRNDDIKVVFPEDLRGMNDMMVFGIA
jgi:hypothetical protein